MRHPINDFQWRDPATLRANLYNPNFVMDAELKLLALSLTRAGWIQPILCTPALTIIDGFHRWRLSQEPNLIAVLGREVPVAILDIPEDEARAWTVRMNRAKGTHAAVRMADLVKELIDQYGWTVERVMLEIGASREEIGRLYEDSIFVAKGLKDYRYSKAWVPEETGKRKGGAA